MLSSCTGEVAKQTDLAMVAEVYSVFIHVLLMDENIHLCTKCLMVGCSFQALHQLQDELLSHVVQFPMAIIDPSPFQLVEMTSLTKVLNAL